MNPFARFGISVGGLSFLSRPSIFAIRINRFHLLLVVPLLTVHLNLVAGVKVAFTADQGNSANAEAVLQLIADEGSDLLLLQGDLGYTQGASTAWESNLVQYLGADFPVLGVVGNHENFEWLVYQALLTARINRIDELTCTGEIGVKALCTFRGLEIVQVAPGISEVSGVLSSDNYDAFIQQTFSASSAPWRICSWHKNMRLMQVGRKFDETGWGVYQACLNQGALVATGHEHTYSRTHLMDSFEFQSVVHQNNHLELDNGHSFAFVSALGGDSIRPQHLYGNWWAAAHTSTQNGNYGALFCTFAGSQGDCYFKNIAGVVIDAFTIESRVGSVQSVFLNQNNISVALGNSMPPEPFSNRSTVNSLASIIDAGSAIGYEIHSETTHVAVNDIPLELIFNFGQNYDLSSFHFWNYTDEEFDVDQVELYFQNALGNLILTQVFTDPPAGIPGAVANAIYAKDFPIEVTGVRRVRAIISGSNNKLDFQNIGFSGMISLYPGGTCNGLPVTVDLAGFDAPTIGEDVILGTPGDDIINALGGDDTICGGDGADMISAGNGDDWIDAGEGSDIVLGGSGGDVIFGGSGDDYLSGGPDDDILYGEQDDDNLVGNSGSDIIDGSSGVDRISGGSGDDIITTGSGATVGSGVIVDGGAGNDIITGGPDADEIRGSSDNDTIMGGVGADRIFGGGGVDNINGQAGDDFLRGNGSNDTLKGGSGMDDINGGSGNDTIIGGADNDVLSGSTGNDIINGQSGNDIIFGGGGNDILRGDSGSDTLAGGGSNDDLDGGGGAPDSCDGETGFDTASFSCEVVANVP